jgi:hypothetical protein
MRALNHFPKIDFHGKTLRLGFAYADQGSNYWRVATNDPAEQTQGFTPVTGTYVGHDHQRVQRTHYVLRLPGSPSQYSAYRPVRFPCLYRGDAYWVASLWEDGRVFLGPGERAKRKLGIPPRDDRNVELTYAELLAAGATIWEIREPIASFRFDVAPLVVLLRRGQEVANPAPFADPFAPLGHSSLQAAYRARMEAMRTTLGAILDRLRGFLAWGEPDAAVYAELRLTYRSLQRSMGSPGFNPRGDLTVTADGFRGIRAIDSLPGIGARDDSARIEMWEDLLCRMAEEAQLRRELLLIVGHLEGIGGQQQKN